ncbi:Pyridine nucleotide-disulfide oxidoreductase, NAD-binding domain protein [Cordyceps fumosorosea ARSEF 2679]|uniref:Pyridine nucleotide-disulfide oxidoreductase, NAD-binding domain protein n=1 Tax=Cordyceps fumosorosea (strain ARSEF 2679) TaxID=1081104 RepID=A0A168CMZ1_CORFA|nr:Pyridine nucleotide-disulfide oxidoreductase, NAD-binding domain protein [Cordyceps fumosorosea ARSEF 2679]OAA71576.1 Pyridine nucleotide-disulfide oxidoreductase, NAD-binding domain protein [Cordyceps fumosorosea ARSEF 2679]
MKTIVILGTGLAAAAVIRQTMKSTVLTRSDTRMIVVGPSTHFVWPIAMPRAIVPGQLAEERFLFPLGPTFAEYPADRFEFVLGTASALDPDARTVQVALNDGHVTRHIAYDVLVIATGAASRDDIPWKALATTEDTLAELRGLQRRIEGAKTVVVAGGGMTGVEAVAELGYEYARSGRKQVYLVHDEDLPLSSAALPSVRKQVRAELAKLGVKVIPNTKVTRATTTADGETTTLELTAADGGTRSLATQAYVPARGVVPNTAFAPARMLDDRGYVRQTATLQAGGRYDDVFVIGDAGSLEANKAAAADAQARHLIAALPLYLEGKTLPEYKPETKDIFAVTLGRSRGTGQMGSWKLWSVLVWYLKGRFLGTDYADRVAAGKRTLTTKFE